MACDNTGSMFRGSIVAGDAATFSTGNVPGVCSTGTVSRTRRQAATASSVWPVGTISHPRSGETPHTLASSASGRRWMLAMLGRRYSDVVSLIRPSPSPSGRMDCTVPLPNERLPTTFARPLSCRQAAIISPALAVIPSIRTTIGMPANRLPGVARRTSSGGLFPAATARPRVETMTPFSRNRSQTSTADVSNPPGLPRRSRIIPRSPAVELIACKWMSSIARWRSASVWSPKLVIRISAISESPSSNHSHKPSGRRRSPSTLSILTTSRTTFRVRRVS